MTLNIFYKQFSGNDSFETTEDRQSVYLDKIEAEHPGILCTMEAAIERSILGLPLVNQDTLEQSLSYIVTNNASCGAIALFYRGAMERFAQLIGNFFVIPSSTEEVILMPEGDPTRINKMIRGTNAYVEDNLVLDNHAYFFNKETGTLKPVVSLSDSIAERRLA